MDKKERFLELLQAYREGTLAVSLQEELFTLITSRQYDDLLQDMIDQDLKNIPAEQLSTLPPHISQDIMRNILHAEKHTAAVLPARRLPWWKTLAAAAAFLAIGLTTYFLFIREAAEKTFAHVIPGNIQLLSNPSDTVLPLRLTDGSTVRLQPKSSLHYPLQFSDTSREVYLEGSAFFDVTPDRQKPFLVYSNRIVTRVLGTSFYINTKTASGKEEISVKTGKVLVSSNEKISLKGPSIIVTPNQKAIYEPERGIFEATLVETPRPILREAAPIPVITALSFTYDQVKLEKVFRDLSDVYGIEIIPENSNLLQCRFTGDVSDEDLFTKLKIICLTTRSNYEVQGTRILIQGKGCD